MGKINVELMIDTTEKKKKVNTQNDPTEYT